MRQITLRKHQVSLILKIKYFKKQSDERNPLLAQESSSHALCSLLYLKPLNRSEEPLDWKRIMDAFLYHFKYSPKRSS